MSDKKKRTTLENALKAREALSALRILLSVADEPETDFFIAFMLNVFRSYVDNAIDELNYIIITEEK